MEKNHFRIGGLCLLIMVIISVFIIGVYAATVPCGDSSYDPEKQACCQGKVYDNPKQVAPCGDSCYDPSSQSCCKGQVYDGLMWGECKGVCFNRETQVCCDGYPVNGSRCYSSCHGVQFNENSQSCCNGQIVLESLWQCLL